MCRFQEFCVKYCYSFFLKGGMVDGERSSEERLQEESGEQLAAALGAPGAPGATGAGEAGMRSRSELDRLQVRQPSFSKF